MTAGGEAAKPSKFREPRSACHRFPAGRVEQPWQEVDGNDLRQRPFLSMHCEGDPGCGQERLASACMAAIPPGRVPPNASHGSQQRPRGTPVASNIPS